MKKTAKFRTIMFAILCMAGFSANAQLKVSTYGNVGIGTTAPQHKLDINLGTSNSMRIHTWLDGYIDNSGYYGEITLYPERSFYMQIGKSDKKVGELWACEINGQWVAEVSDIRYKANVQPVTNALSVIKQVNGIRYSLKEELFDGFPAQKIQEYTREDYGFSAQELKEILPELVVEDSTGMLAVRYTRMIPILVEAVKEQQTIIEELKQQNNLEQEMLREQIVELKEFISDNIGGNRDEGNIIDNHPIHNAQTMTLYQNTPNPFNEATTIRFNIDSSVKNVQLCIYDINGVCEKCIQVEERGDVEVKISAGELSSGIHVYLLRGDGMFSESRQMVITK